MFISNRSSVIIVRRSGDCTLSGPLLVSNDQEKDCTTLRN